VVWQHTRFLKGDRITTKAELITGSNQDLADYKEHAALAGELGNMELQMKLEELAADEAGHARELRRILKGL
jgi:rubrerythrin